jgi:hypothetical protein
MQALDRCDFCGEQAAGTFQIIPEELDPTEAERRRVVLCDSCRAQLETLIEPLLDRAGAPAEQTTSDSSTESTAATETDSESESGQLIGASDDGSLLGGGDESDQQESADEQEDSAEEETTESTESTQPTHSPEAGPDDPPENYGKVLRLLRNRDFPMPREEVVTIATSAYSLSARNVRQVIDEAVDRGEFVETGGQLERA